VGGQSLVVSGWLGGQWSVVSA